MSSEPRKETKNATQKNHMRFQLRSIHLAPVFGSDGFGKKAEAFARFFGTPTFLIGQTIIVALWIALNVTGIFHFDLYPFILLNLAFSLQAAYAAPLILLAQTRQADRDKANAENDALHREEIAALSSQRQTESEEQLKLLVELMKRNTELTELTHRLSSHIDELSSQIHDHIIARKP